ncbi:MAG: ATP-binding protein [Polyangiaceae bacterium]
MMIGWVWTPVVLISVAHYATSGEQAWVHDVLRRVYYVPIIVAGAQAGLRGGLLAAVMVSLTYLPHAFLHMGHLLHMDPADTLHKALEIVLYNVVGSVAGVLADRERKRRAELEVALEEQQRLQAELVRAGRLSALGEVVAGIAHEIKNPLHALKGTAEIVDGAIPAEAEERRLWELHRAELERLSRVSERFSSFARPSEPELRPTDLREIASAVGELVAADARKRRVQLEVSCPPDSVTVMADRDQLVQVVFNVVVNAFHALAVDGGRVLLGVPEEAPPRIVIENDGPPIPEEDLERLFDPFVAGPGGGSGLGLSISSRIVQQHSGRLRAENAGLGVRFTLALPQLGERVPAQD